jgi:mannitol/fructose-specific phosphotransferase system IIA component (Ntr-type)
MKICDYLKDSNVFLNMKSRDKKEFLDEMITALKERGVIDNHKKILGEVLKREGLGSTGLEKGIAIPHALTKEVESTVLALAVARDGIDFEAADQKPSYIILLLLGNKSNPGYQLKLLAHVCRLVKETPVIEKIRKAKTVTDVCKIFSAEESKIG